MPYLDPQQNREYQKNWMRQHAEAARASCRARKRMLTQKVADYKNRPCADCGQSFPSYVMDLDHVCGTKVADVSHLVSMGRPWKVIEAEIRKCEVVCANCHRIRTHVRAC